MRTTHRAGLVAGLAALALTLSACAGGGQAATADDGVFRHAVFPEVGSINPFTATQPQELQVITYAYESLLYAAPDGEQLPWLAESWEVSDDGTSVTFALRDGVTFQDGTAFDADVAAANILFHTDPENATILADVLPEGLTATAEDDSTLVVAAPAVDPFLAEIVGSISMVGTTGLDDPSTLDTAANGTSLYALEDVSADTYTFERRDDYTWGPDGLTSETEGLPETIEVSVVADASTRANLLLSGQLNAAAVEGPDQDRIEGAGYDFVGTINPIGQMLFNERPDRPTSDPLVREALVLGFDHEEASEVVSGGRPEELTSWITDAPFTCFSEEPVWDRPDSDPARAAELLDEAGWVVGADGMRERDGQPLEIDFLYDATSTSHAAGAELLAEDWAELGIQTNLNAMDGAAWSEYLYETFDYDTGWIQIGVGSPVTQDLFYGGAFPEDGGLNFMGVADPAYDEIAAQARTAPDPEAACALWQEAEAIVVDDFHTFLLTGTIRPTYMAGATFEFTDYLQPSTIRMTD